MVVNPNRTGCFSASNSEVALAADWSFNEYISELSSLMIGIIAVMKSEDTDPDYRENSSLVKKEMDLDFGGIQGF